jgi:hypothetical protein
MALKETKALELGCMVMAQGENLVSALFSKSKVFQAEMYVIKACLTIEIETLVFCQSSCY